MNNRFDSEGEEEDEVDEINEIDGDLSTSEVFGWALGVDVDSTEQAPSFFVPRMNWL